MIQEQLKWSLDRLKVSFADYKITIIGISAFTLYAAVCSVLPYDYELLLFTYENSIYYILTLFCTGSLFVETCFQENRRPRLCGFAGAALAAGAFTYFIGLDGTFWIGGISGDLLSESAERFMAGYILLLLVLTVYCSFRRTGIRFEEYALKVFSNLFKTFILYVILMIGAAIVTGIFSALFLEDGGFYLDLAAGILVIGFYLVPNSILSLNDMKSEPGPFLKVVVKYVLTALTVCAALIVYLYVLKIVILWEMPSNEIFSILSALFCFGMPVWVIAACYQDGTRYARLIMAMPYIFAPLICLQIYSMGIRIWQYGMTVNRYMGMMLVIFEIGTILIWHFLKQRREKILLFLCLIIFTSVFAPGINMFSLSNSWQFSFLKKYYQCVDSGVKLSALESERLTGAWKYLKREERMQDALKDYNLLSEGMIDKLEEGQEDIQITQYDTHYIHCCKMVEQLDVNGYQKVFMLDQDHSYDKAEQGGVDVDFSKFRFLIRGTEEVVTVDLQGFAQRCMDYERKHPNVEKDEITDVMRGHSRMVLEDGRVLCLNHFQVTYQDGIKDGKKYFSWQTVELGGILLEN